MFLIQNKTLFFKNPLFNLRHFQCLPHRKELHLKSIFSLIFQLQNSSEKTKFSDSVLPCLSSLLFSLLFLSGKEILAFFCENTCNPSFLYSIFYYCLIPASQGPETNLAKTEYSLALKGKGGWQLPDSESSSVSKRGCVHSTLMHLFLDKEYIN